MTAGHRAAFDPSTPLFQVLRHPAGHDLVARHAPGVVASPLLHTFHLRPIGLVLATEDGLGETERSAILQGIGALDPDATAGAGSSPAAQRGPSSRYEGDDVTRGSARMTAPRSGAVWERLEIRIDGPAHGNPFVDVDLDARFRGPDGREHEVPGFYDGDGVYRVRFLPPVPGQWSVAVRSTARSLDGLAASFVVRESDHRGPVRVADRFHFAYADGTRYTPVGTTCYAWTHQGDRLEEETLRSLAASPFTKVRMCVFPKSYTFNANEPERYPFLRTAEGWDPTRFDPAFWAHLERRIEQLGELGIEADLILFHAYDRWGFSTMAPEQDDRYVRYAVARLAAFPNLWWSLANEFDLLVKDDADWHRFAGIIERGDPAGHLRSIHNCLRVFDHDAPWVTHVSMQRTDLYRTAEETTGWRSVWGKPVVVDECAYEGDIDQGWGNISGQEMVRRAWEGAVRGGYVGHGETYMDPDDVLWWAKGGVLHGDSPARFGFLARVIAEAPDGVLEPLEPEWDVPVAGVEGVQRLYYFGFGRPSFRRFFLDPAERWHVDLIDTWHMTVDTLPGTFSGRFVVPMPAREFMAVRLRRHGDNRSTGS